MSKEKLTDSEKRILRELIYPETFEHIQAETSLSYGEIRNDLIQLINHRFIQVNNRNHQIPGHYFDSDHIEDFTFKATMSGLKKIQHEPV